MNESLAHPPGELETLEPALDVETSPMMEPPSLVAAQAPGSATAPSRYWQAQGLADILQKEFDQAHTAGDVPAMRECFYVLANYFSRTMAIARGSLASRREPLLQAALHNIIALHKPLHYMHRVAPDAVPMVLGVRLALRNRLIEDLVMRVLQESPEPLDLGAVARRTNDLDLLADAKESAVRQRLGNLISTGHVQMAEDRYSRSGRPYSGVNLDRAVLEHLVGPELFARFEAAGFGGLREVSARQDAFRSFFTGLTGFSDGSAGLFVAATSVLTGGPGAMPDMSPWRYADLIGSSYPRPYQYEAYAIFRGYGYQGQVIEAPTGSGKTMIGMMCMQDWLRTMSQGQSILVVVPTVNYQQQWLGELCYKPIGLRLSPDVVFTGTPAALEAVRRRTGLSPCVIVATYAALAQLGSGVGKGGFDRDSIEIVLQGNNVRYVILDEVHKVVEDMHSVSADVTKALTEWVHDGSLKGLIGFSGTAAAFRPRFAQLGLHLVYIMPAAELIAYGFVAPFAELGLPFAYSDREERIHALLNQYKGVLRQFLVLVGGANCRRWLAEIPAEERVRIGRDILRMYAGRQEQNEALARRFAAWEKGGELALTEAAVVTVVQIARGWTDEDLVRAAAGADATVPLAEFRALCTRLDAIREEMKGFIYLADALRRLGAEGFASTFDAAAVRRLPAEVPSAAVRAERVRDLLATTIVGLYDTLTDWYLRVGEGRVDSIKAVIAAERDNRPIQGVIVFDKGKRIRWQAGLAVPGYGGVAGLFGQMLGDQRFTPMAVLSSEIYMSWAADAPLPGRIAGFIKRSIMLGELGDALFGLATQGIDLSDAQLASLRAAFDSILKRYVDGLREVGAARPEEFDRLVLVPFRTAVRAANLGKTQEAVLARLSMRHYHMSKWISIFFDYALIITAFLRAHVAELEQVSGARQKFFVVRMASGARKQLMYDLTARIVDAEENLVDMIIVSPWARTGWNVVKPNLLIDATATRDVTAWQQLRGRAMRAMRSWSNDCYRLVLLLMGSRALGLDDTLALPEDVVAGSRALLEKSTTAPVLDGALKAILLAAHQQVAVAGQEADALAAKIERSDVAAFTPEERMRLATELMLARNKVTHIYELVKAYGGASQVRYDRPSKQWVRTDAIAAKHDQEFAVSLVTGQYASGQEHAPLVYSGDPRRDVPSALQAHLWATLQGADPRIVGGWLAAIATGIGEEASLE